MLQKQTAEDFDHGALERAILAYQASLAQGSHTDIDEAYRAVCLIYDPMDYVHKWHSYVSFFDSREDFIADYLMVFAKVLKKWKPRGLRTSDRYGGKGHFANYFWGSLAHNYSNIVKQESAGKRNMSSKCPLCDEWVHALSTHLLEAHSSLMWEKLGLMGYKLSELKRCPFCKSFKAHRQNIEDALKSHLLAKHSPFLFERFNELYPNHHTLSPKPLSVYGGDMDDDGEVDLYDTTPGGDGMSALLALDLSDVQRTIVEHILNGSRTVAYNPKLYKCSQEEFDEELERLRDSMTICGLNG